jgi:MFS transporter, PAT family, beta-lactamase induction signal transducer AmpG
MTARALSGTSKLGLLGALYFSQGLPFGFFTQGLPVLLRQRGFSLAQIGLSSLLAAPWALKWLWAPQVDRHFWPSFGRRRSWIVPLQLLTVVVLLGLSAVGAFASMLVLMIAVSLLNLLAATQDIATDGLAVELLAADERGLANGLQVAGYRLGMIVGGGALLILHDRLGNTGTFMVMAALTAVATLPVLRLHEPSVVTPPSVGAKAVYWLRRPGAASIVLLLVVYKAGDAFATSMLRPFLADRGLTLADIGWLLGTVGFVAGLVGALVGGVLVNRVGRKPALLSFGLLQALTVGGYAYLAFVKLGTLALYGLCGAEHFAGGMATAALFTCMMDWSSDHSSGSDYTVQASAVVLATGAAGAMAGMSAQALGYVGHFGLATVLALAALVVVQFLFPSSAQVACLLSPSRGQ